MNRSQPLDRLDFDDQLFVDQEINAKPVAKGRALENDRQKFLPFNWQSETSETLREQCLVNRFQQSGTKRLVQT